MQEWDMIRQSRQHLASVNEGYFEHMRHALSFAGRMLAAGLALSLHALCPGVFETTGSRAVFKLNAILCARAAQAVCPEPQDGR